MASNATLSARNRSPLDEWRTSLVDVEAELGHYADQLAGKTVYCNCDDSESNFVRYFISRFKALGLKRLVASCYSGTPQKLEFDGETVEVSPLVGDGDFRSGECLALLDEADVIVTNPPFSLFREYVNTLIEHGNQFLIMGDQNGAKYSDVFPHVVAGRLWFGYENGGCKWFKVPDDYEIKTESRKRIVEGVKYQSIGRIYWYTNLQTRNRDQLLPLTKKYDPRDYPTYTNYPAIEVSKVADIPADYAGEMGVPITYLPKHNPRQFQIVGLSTKLAKPMKQCAPEGTFANGSGKFFIPDGSGKHVGVYERVVIRRALDN